MTPEKQAAIDAQAPINELDDTILKKALLTIKSKHRRMGNTQKAALDMVIYLRDHGYITSRTSLTSSVKNGRINDKEDTLKAIEDNERFFKNFKAHWNGCKECQEVRFPNEPPHTYHRTIFQLFAYDEQCTVCRKSLPKQNYYSKLGDQRELRDPRNL